MKSTSALYFKQIQLDNPLCTNNRTCFFMTEQLYTPVISLNPNLPDPMNFVPFGMMRYSLFLYQPHYLLFMSII